MAQNSKVPCPFCAEEIRPEAKKCKHCGEWIAGSRPTELVEGTEGRGLDATISGRGQVRLSNRKVGAWILALILAGFFISMLLGEPDDGAAVETAGPATAAQAEEAPAPLRVSENSAAVVEAEAGSEQAPNEAPSAAQAAPSGPQPLNIQLVPANAAVTVREDRFGGESYSGEGPTASFTLSPGDYRYMVTAPLHKEYSGQFSVPDNKNLSVALEPEFVPAQTTLPIAEWLMQGGWEGQGVVFRKTLGDAFLNTSTDPGYSYALVPIAIKNNSNSTASLSFPTWRLHDEAGYEYETETLADLYLGDRERLDAAGVPPGSTRSGFLIFQVRDGVRDLYLTFDGFRFDGTWHFSVQ
jgi:hypothetical protein